MSKARRLAGLPTAAKIAKLANLPQTPQQKAVDWQGEPERVCCCFDLPDGKRGFKVIGYRVTLNCGQTWLYNRHTGCWSTPGQKPLNLRQLKASYGPLLVGSLQLLAKI